MTFKDSPKPFIKKFRHKCFFYIYDVNTNQIVEVDKPVFDIIDNYDENHSGQIETRCKGIHACSQLEESFEQIKRAKTKHGLFSHFRPEMITLGIGESIDIKKLHEKGLKQLLLEITRLCNLNCRYCNTSGKYSDNLSYQELMSHDTCKKSVDFFCENSRNSDEPFISFYGGEPLLRFGLIKEIVEYVKKKQDGNKYRFNLTTNGTLINKEIIDFFIEHDFLLMVSLDGPEHVNDRYRVTRDGKGTFYSIMKNLEFIKRYNPDYYSRRVSISNVLAPPFDNIDKTINFFSENETLEEIRVRGGIRSSPVNTKETSFLEDFGLKEDMKNFKHVRNKFIKGIKISVLAHDLSKLTIEKRTIYTILSNLALRPIQKLYDHVPPLGACHIGLRRVFVRTNGDFYVCERSGDDYKIGCVNTGFDYETIVGYYRKLEEVLADCKDCWAINLCERCWVQIGNLEEFTGQKKEEFCSTQKKIIEKAFKVYTELLREDPDCLKVFKNSE